MSNNLLITGLFLNHDVLGEELALLNYQEDIFLANPTLFLWHDEIIVTPTLEKSILSLDHKNDTYQFLPQINKLIFEILDSKNIITRKTFDNTQSEELSNTIDSIIDNDVDILLSGNDTSIFRDDNVPGGINVSGTTFCFPALRFIYISLFLSKYWSCDLILSNPIIDLLHHRAVSQYRNSYIEIHQSQIFNSIINERLPLLDFKFRNGERACWNCAKISSCDGSDFVTFEKRFLQYLEYRDYDEIIQMKHFFERLNKTIKKSDYFTVPEILKEYSHQTTAIRKKVKKVFPRVERWSNIITLLSIPVVVAGISAASVPLASVGAGAGGVAQALSLYTKIFKNKTSWLFTKFE